MDIFGRSGQWRPGRSLGLTVLLTAVLLAGCKQRPPQQPTKTRPAVPPASKPAPPASEPAQTQPVTQLATQPTTQPATRPATPPTTQPSSSYDSKPPYPVRLYVRSPEDKQPGWLKIMQLADADSLATCRGEFPERNRICIETDNVRILRLHISHLPLAARKRIVLRIDDQGIELAHKKRAYVILERRSTGEWVVAKPRK